jgi:hypothetical protein
VRGFIFLIQYLPADTPIAEYISKNMDIFFSSQKIDRLWPAALRRMREGYWVARHIAPKRHIC